MATVSSLGAGSGLDLNGLLTKLMTAEQQPLNLVRTQQAAYNTKISAYGTISSKLASLLTSANNLKSATGLEAYKATSSDTTIASGTTSTGAAIGTYNVHVGNLASAHTLVSGGVTDASAAIDSSEATGKLRIGVAGSTFDITVTAANNSLNGIRDAINNASDNKGVSAAVVTDASGSRLTLVSKNTGSANTITVAVDETGSGLFTGDVGSDPQNSNATGLSKLAFIGATANLNQTQAAANAALTINSVPISSASNAVTGAVAGLTLNLGKAGDTTVTVTRDSEASDKLINSFLTTFNDLQTTTRGLTSYDAATKKGSALNGESTARDVLSNITRAIQSSPSGITGSFKTLSDIGITFNKDGTLVMDSTKMQAATTKDFASVKSVLTAYASAVSTSVTSMTDTKGLVTNRVAGLNASVKLYGERAESMIARLTLVEARYRRQFTALDTLVSQGNATSSYLTAQLAKL